MVRSLQPPLCASRPPSTKSHVRGKAIHSLVSNIHLGPQRRRAGALHDASRLTARSIHAPAFSECGGPPPLWNTSTPAKLSNHGSFPPAASLREPQAPANSHARGKAIHPLVGKRRLGPQRRRAGALHDASRPTALPDHAPASSECGGPPPLWNTSTPANQSSHGSFPPAASLREPQAPANSHARGKAIHPLVGKRRLGPQRRRAGALHDASRLTARSIHAPAFSECGGPPPLWNTSPLANPRTMVRSLATAALREPPPTTSRVREKSIHPLVGNICAGPQRRRAGALHDASRSTAYSHSTRQRLRSAVALHRFGTRFRLPTRATMVRSLAPPLCVRRKPPANSHAHEKSIHPVVGNIRVGPQRRRAGALQDASRPTAYSHNAPASSECGGPPPLWNTAPLANQSNHGSFPPVTSLREPSAIRL